MARREYITLKEYYWLWWQYLEQSKKYKDLCEAIQEANVKSTHYLPDNIRKDRYGDKKRIIFVYDSFGNIFRAKFEDWWNYSVSMLAIKMEEEEKNNAESVSTINTNSFVEIVKSALKNTIDELSQHGSQQRTISIRELEDSLLVRVKRAVSTYITYYDKLCLKIDLSSQKKTEDIAEKVRKLISKKRADPAIKFMRDRNLQPKLTKSRANNIERFLEVYKLREQKRMKWPEIVVKINQNDNSDSASGHKRTSRRSKERTKNNQECRKWNLPRGLLSKNQKEKKNNHEPSLQYCHFNL